MKVLAIESSSMVAGAAVADEDKIISEYFLNHKKTHSQTLMPVVDRVLDSCELSISDIDIFAAAQGPGSFTGLRIGISTIKGLAQSANKPVVGISTLDGLAYNMAYADGIICPIMDARREQVYTCLYEWDSVSLHRLSEYMALPLIDLINILKEKDKKVIFNGDGVSKYHDIIKEHMGENAEFAPITCRLNRASSIACLALKEASSGHIQSYMDLVPFYLRKSQAEQKQMQKR